MQSQSSDSRYRQLAEALLEASRDANWSECHRLLEERERLRNRDSLDDHLKVLDVDMKSLTLMELERDRILESLNQLDQGFKMLQLYSSHVLPREQGIRFEG